MEHREVSINPGEYSGVAKHIQREVRSMWYVIQTVTKKERELADVINKIVDKKWYEKCFVLQRECLWRLEGQYRMHIEPIFPSYLFVETNTPESFFFALKKVPQLAKLIGCDGVFWTVKEEEEKLLCQLIGNDEDYIVRASLVHVDLEGTIISAEGALKDYVKKIIKKRLRKRSVVIEIPFLGQTKRIQLGIRLEGDHIENVIK